MSSKGLSKKVALHPARIHRRQFLRLGFAAVSAIVFPQALGRGSNSARRKAARFFNTHTCERWMYRCVTGRPSGGSGQGRSDFSTAGGVVRLRRGLRRARTPAWGAKLSGPAARARPVCTDPRMHAKIAAAKSRLWMGTTERALTARHPDGSRHTERNIRETCQWVYIPALLCRSACRHWRAV